MTEREMADKRILQLVMLLYDICKDVLYEVFKHKSLKGNETDQMLSTYLSEHKLKLLQHVIELECHNCASKTDLGNCIYLSQKQLKSFYVFNYDATVDKIHELSVRKLRVKELSVQDLDISMLQYLLLADDLDSAQHSSIIQLYSLRQKVSHLPPTKVPESTVEKIWQGCEKAILELTQSLGKLRQEKTIKYINVLKTSQPKWEMASDSWYQMRNEFNIQNPIPVEIDQVVQVEEAELQQKCYNIKGHNVAIGQNNLFQSFQREISEEQLSKIENRVKKVLTEDVELINLSQMEGNKILVARLMKDHVQPPKEEDKLDIAEGGKGIFDKATQSEVENEPDMQPTEFRTNLVLTEDKMKELQQTGSIELSFGVKIDIVQVRKGSVIIEAKLPSWIIADRTLFMNAVTEFLQEIVKRFSIDTSSDIFLEVDIYTPFSKKDKSTTIPNLAVENESICAQCTEKRGEILKLRQKIDNMEKKYLKILPLSYSLTTPKEKPVDSVKNCSGYDAIDENTIYMADFPNDKVSALCDYLHIADNQTVSTMTKGMDYFLIKQVGDWLEIQKGIGKSFFVMAEYCKSLDATVPAEPKPIRDIVYHTIAEDDVFPLEAKMEGVPKLPPKRSSFPLKPSTFIEKSSRHSFEAKDGNGENLDKKDEEEIISLVLPSESTAMPVRSQSETTTSRPLTWEVSGIEIKDEETELLLSPEESKTLPLRGKSRKTIPRPISWDASSLREERERKTLSPLSQEIRGIGTRIKSFFSSDNTKITPENENTQESGRWSIFRTSKQFSVDSEGRKTDSSGHIMNLLNFKEIRKLIHRLLKRRQKRETLVKKGMIKATVFGSSLLELCKNEDPVVLIPSFVKNCVLAIEKRGLHWKRLYLVQSEKSDVFDLRYDVERCTYDLHSAKWNVYTLTNILLQLFDEMETPLLPPELSQILTKEHDERARELKIRLQRLPESHFETFRFLCEHFRRILENSEENEVTMQTLAESVGPSLMHVQSTPQYSDESKKTSSDILAMCLTEYDFIFDKGNNGP